MPTLSEENWNIEYDNANIDEAIEERVATLPPFYFICVFWRRRYWREFSNLCLASMLAPGNIPALDESIRSASRFVIVTTRQDWAELQDDPTFRLMQRYIKPLFLELPRPKPDESKMLVMSRGHALASEEAFRARAYGVYLTPDLVLSDGSVVALQRLGRAGKKVVLCVAIRFSEEGSLPELKARGLLKPGEPMVLPARQLVDIALRNLHTETRRYDWDCGYFAESPISPYWEVPGGNGILIHSFSWAPLLIDYSALAEHDATTFDNWTLDGDYVYRNFGEHGEESIHVVTDSDEIMLVSFTREADLHFELTPDWWKAWPLISRQMKRFFLRRLFFAPEIDDLKRRTFLKSVKLHAGDFTPEWDVVENRAKRIIRDAVNPPRWWIVNFGNRLLNSFFYGIVYWPARIRAVLFGMWGTLKGTPGTPTVAFSWRRCWNGFILPYYRLWIRAPIINKNLALRSFFIRLEIIYDNRFAVGKKNREK